MNSSLFQDCLNNVTFCQQFDLNYSLNFLEDGGKVMNFPILCVNHSVKNYTYICTLYQDPNLFEHIMPSNIHIYAYILSTSIMYCIYTTSIPYCFLDFMLNIYMLNIMPISIHICTQMNFDCLVTALFNKINHFAFSFLCYFYGKIILL